MRDEVRAEDLTGKEPYKLLVGSVVPRAIAWVATVSAEGVANIAALQLLHRRLAQPADAVLLGGALDPCRVSPSRTRWPTCVPRAS